uniref:uncharacterized protein LOC109970916 n=1 Tax=Monopterus albus TaxID=43700 RepID=UPI0009B3E566|nr:uncharacterized protein LOC109970916 [Monopterus albus]
MGQTVMEHTLPVEDACCMGPDESVLILIKHCQDMKQQETRLRLITLLLLFICTALFIFTTGADLRQHFGSKREMSTVEQSPVPSKQQSLCPAVNPKTSCQNLHIHLRSVATGNTSDGQLIKWDVMFGDNYYYNEEKRAILIHENGLYFVYIRITLSCRSEDGPEGFSVKLQRWNKGYDMIVPLTDAKDGVDCTSQRSRNVFVGQLFDLSEGDHLSVWIDQGYKLIATASAGAFCI